MVGEGRMTSSEELVCDYRAGQSETCSLAAQFQSEPQSNHGRPVSRLEDRQAETRIRPHSAFSSVQAFRGLDKARHREEGSLPNQSTASNVNPIRKLRHWQTQTRYLANIWIPRGPAKLTQN